MDIASIHPFAFFLFMYILCLYPFLVAALYISEAASENLWGGNAGVFGWEGARFGYQASFLWVSVQVSVPRERTPMGKTGPEKERRGLMEGRDSTVFFCASIPSDRQTRSLKYKCTCHMWLLIDLMMLAFGCESVPHGSNLRTKGSKHSDPLSFPREWTAPTRTHGHVKSSIA